MHVPDGATMAHVQWSQFTGLYGLLALVALARAFSLIRMFLGRG